MWIVRVALNRPYTFIVLALFLVLYGAFTIIRTPTDIFPAIRIPIISQIWSYSGLPPEDMANRMVGFSERGAVTVINDIEHIESQSLNGIAVVKYFFQPHVNAELALAQIVASSQSQLRTMPPGTTAPFILSYNASSVPIVQLALTSATISEAKLFDMSNSLIRAQLATVPGASMPFPYGGQQRQVVVDLNPAALRAYGLSAQDVSSAIGRQNLILPAGTQKIADTEYYVKLNSSPQTVAELNDLPIRADNGNVVYIRDVAHVRDGGTPQTNVVRVSGQRAILMTILKTGSASTLDVIDEIKHRLPSILDTLPSGLKISLLNDQSIFVRAAVNGVIREGLIAAALTGLMILLFLGSWRSTLIITISIPLSILASIIVLSALGETINIMTLGGFALAVGILVDDATVAIENINWHLEQGKEVEPAILDGAQQIAVPALVSTFCICIVFVPMFFLTGVAKFLFVPMAEAVVFAMLASYVLSRTLVPTLAKYWLHVHEGHEAPPEGASLPARLKRFQLGFEERFGALRARYHVLLERAITNRRRFAKIFGLAVAASFLLAIDAGPLPGLGRDFFPSVDSGQIKLHFRAPAGTRIESTTHLCDKIETEIRKIIPAGEIESLVDNIGVPNSGINLSYSTSAPIGPGDADIMISLVAGHKPTAGYIRTLRKTLNAAFPEVTFSFLPADITSQILNFGLPGPLDIQVIGNNVAANRALAYDLLGKMQKIPGAVDWRIQQAFNYPQIQITVNRTKAAQLGISQQSIANDLLISLSGSFQTSPAFWLDPSIGLQYNVTTQAPQYKMQSLNDLAITPIGASSGDSGLLATVADFQRSAGLATVSHYDTMPVIDIYASVQDTDLGSVASDVRKILADAQKDVPKGSKLSIRGQAETMRQSFNGLGVGLVAAIVLVYLLIVINFQSWLDPFIIITALPAALAGIVWMLFLTHTTLSVPSLTGAIMCMGVATANSILVVSFARERVNAGASALTAALEAGFTRFRPVIMTALAMIVGMIPMALGLGEGGEQNAPLGRAVIGGLIFATVATLFFVPTIFCLIHAGRDETLPANPS